MLSEKDKQYIEHMLTNEIECKKNNGTKVFIPFREFITKSITEIDQAYFLKMLNDYKNSSITSCRPLLLNKFEEFFLAKPLLYYEEFPDTISVSASLYFSYNNFFSAFSYLKELINSENECKKIYYSQFKTTGLFYSFGEYIFTIYPNDTVSIHTADLKIHYYTIESLYEDRNDRVFIIQSRDSGQIGEFRLKPIGKAELSFGGRVILKLKI